MARVWDELLYAGAAEYYRVGRLPYPDRLGTTLRELLGLDGTGRLMDLGCGPGSLTIPLAPLFATVVAVDADPQMVSVGAAEAGHRGVSNVRWVRACAEDLGDDTGRFDVVTLAQSFHWMDRPVVAEKIRRWLVAGGCCVHLGATTHEGAPDASGLRYPQPPRQRIDDLVRTYLGPHPRAGRRTLMAPAPGDDQQAFREAGFTGPEVIAVPGGDVFVRTDEQVIASVLSLSSAAPHLFGARLAEFVGDLRDLLRAVSPDGVFAEQLQDMRLFLWRP